MMLLQTDAITDTLCKEQYSERIITHNFIIGNINITEYCQVIPYLKFGSNLINGVAT